MICANITSAILSLETELYLNLGTLHGQYVSDIIVLRHVLPPLLHGLCNFFWSSCASVDLDFLPCYEPEKICKQKLHS